VQSLADNKEASMDVNLEATIFDEKLLNYLEIAKEYFEAKGSSGFILPKFSPESIDALYSTAYNLYEKGKYSEAVHFFRFLTMLKTFERKYWIGLGASQQMCKLYEDAVQSYEAAALMNHNDPYVHFHASECLFLLKKTDRAMDALNAAEIVARQEKKYKNLISQFALIRKTWSNQGKSLEYKELSNA
jgi:type III secretion system low calcium response chaperone LcrH/SycD